MEDISTLIIGISGLTMTVAFADIEDKFDRIFGFIRNDLERMLTLDPGVNFAAATVLACACEILARYRYASGEGAEVFSRLLPSGPLQKIAKTLYDVLRNGLAHRYDTRDIRIDGRIVRLGIAWKEEAHLSVKEIDAVPHFVLNIAELSRDLLSSFEEYKSELVQSDEARDRFFTTFRQLGPKDVTIRDEIVAWQQILKVARSQPV